MAGRFSDRWYSWWRGDEIEATFSQKVAEGLKVVAYETMRAAKQLIVRRAWGEKDAVPGQYFLQRVSEQLTKKGKKFKRRRVRIQKPSETWIKFYKPSEPGESPTNQTGVLKGSIKYAFRDGGDGLMESFAGAIAMSSSTWHGSMTDGIATHALEWGGRTISARMVGKGRKVRRTYEVNIEERPFMRPAGADVLGRGLLRRQLENSVRNISRPRNLAIGWMSS